jgi:hypothetical protein
MMHCRYCNAPHDANKLARHECFCADNPDVRAATLAALADPDLPGTARSTQDYRRAAEGTRALTDGTLLRRYGDWRAVAESFGLEWRGYTRKNTRRLTGISVYARQRTIEAAELEQAAEDAAAEAAARAEMMQPRGLPVCGRRVMTDGRVAWMVR